MEKVRILFSDPDTQKLSNEEKDKLYSLLEEFRVLLGAERVFFKGRTTRSDGSGNDYIIEINNAFKKE